MEAICSFYYASGTLSPCLTITYSSRYLSSFFLRFLSFLPLSLRNKSSSSENLRLAVSCLAVPDLLMAWAPSWPFFSFVEFIFNLTVSTINHLITYNTPFYIKSSLSKRKENINTSNVSLMHLIGRASTTHDKARRFYLKEWCLVSVVLGC